MAKTIDIHQKISTTAITAVMHLHSKTGHFAYFLSLLGYFGLLSMMLFFPKEECKFCFFVWPIPGVFNLMIVLYDFYSPDDLKDLGTIMLRIPNSKLPE